MCKYRHMWKDLCQSVMSSRGLGQEGKKKEMINFFLHLTMSFNLTK